jgi:hypothetical protein
MIMSIYVAGIYDEDTRFTNPPYPFPTNAFRPGDLVIMVSISGVQTTGGVAIVVPDPIRAKGPEWIGLGEASLPRSNSPVSPNIGTGSGYDATFNPYTVDESVLQDVAVFATQIEDPARPLNTKTTGGGKFIFNAQNSLVKRFFILRDTAGGQIQLKELLNPIDTHIARRVIYNHTAPADQGMKAFVVPDGVTSLHIDMAGGAGIGRGNLSNPGTETSGDAGKGGRLEFDLSVQPNDVLFLEVTSNGLRAREIRLNDPSPDGQIAIVGAGGSAGVAPSHPDPSVDLTGYRGGNGGNGGGLEADYGQDGQGIIPGHPDPPPTGGEGGTQTEGGASGDGYTLTSTTTFSAFTSEPGTRNAGDTNLSGSFGSNSTVTVDPGGAGGDGYYGGGSGGNTGYFTNTGTVGSAGGGGGSSWVNTDICSNVVHTKGYRQLGLGYIDIDAGSDSWHWESPGPVDISRTLVEISLCDLRVASPLLIQERSGFTYDSTLSVTSIPGLLLGSRITLREINGSVTRSIDAAKSYFSVITFTLAAVLGGGWQIGSVGWG